MFLMVSIIVWNKFKITAAGCRRFGSDIIFRHPCQTGNGIPQPVSFLHIKRRNGMNGCRRGDFD